MNKVIVLGGHPAVSRSLGKRKDIEVIALSHNKSNIGCVSRYNSEIALTPDPLTHEEEYIDFLLHNGERWNGALLIETGDKEVIAVSKNKHALCQYYKTATADWDILKNYIDKVQLYKLAKESNILYPMTAKPNSMEEVELIRDELPYPCLLKPKNRDIFLRKFGKKNFVARSPNELIKQMNKCFDADLKMLIQEIIPGPDSNFERLHTYVNSKGKLSALFFHNKLRQNPPHFGVMRVGFSTSRNPEVEVFSKKLLNYGGYRGSASIEFKRDSRDGLLKLIEINVRIERSIQIAIAGGINFPWIIYSDIIKDQQLYVEEYIENLYWIELWPDMLNNILNPNKEKRYSIKEYLLPYTAKHKTYAVFDWRDLRPFIKQFWNGIKRIRKLIE
jgi:predicted ATP-grasp superfamily ATP-dependent carboligase